MESNVFHLISMYLQFFARALGFEPRSKVLETSILPLNYARRKYLPSGFSITPYYKQST